MAHTPPVFLHNGRPHRIVGELRPDPDAAFGEAKYNLLQRQRSGFGGLLMSWETVEEERVPDQVRITLGCFGDAGGWTSRLPAAGFAR